MKKTNPIDKILKEHNLIILDGAMATELETHGCDLDDPLWSARVLLENPELIYQVHLDYFRAGADCAITASYQATVEGFAKRGLTEKEALDLIKKTVFLAKKAREDFWKEDMISTRPKPLVAASVGPYGAFLANGSEYIGNYGVSDERLREFHRQRIQGLTEAGADILAFETIPSLQEAKVLVSLLKEFPETYAWIAFSLKDEHSISDGTSLKEVAMLVKNSEQMAAIGLNCAPLDFVTSAVSSLKKYTEKPIIVYPNSGETYDAETKTWHGQESCDTLHSKSNEWYEAGARLIGGCCRTSPQDINDLATTWRK